jgi:alkylation response protein AidB-like acyl-CoA dehydrogenase
VLLEADADTAGRLLPALADGTTVAALAWAGQDGLWDPGRAACRASQDPAGGWRLSGEAHYVLDGDVADLLLVAAHAPDEVAVFEVDPAAAGVTRRAVTTMDSTRRLATVSLDGAAGRPAGCGPAGLARARDLACLALAAEQAGAARQALEQTVAYTKDRVQFGRPIGSFQALQHRMADLHVLTESAWSLCWAAAQDSDELHAAAAKAYCSEALLTVAGQMIQLHGAIGITWEHDAHRYFKRAHGAGQLFGPPSAHLARIADALLPG